MLLSPKAMISRRHTVRAMSAAVLGAGFTGCAMNPVPDIVPQGLGISLTPEPLTDPAVFNFALNLEYLEAEYYLRGVTGAGLEDRDLGPAPKAVRGGRQVAFQTPEIRDMMEEVASDEQAHVRFLRRAIAGSPLVQSSRPAIDLDASFKAAGQLAGLGADFDPFADEDSFLLGAFLFEDVGVTAYNDAAKLLSQRDLLEAAAGILAVEAYHGGMTRSLIYSKGPDMIRKADAISAARDQLDGESEHAEQPPSQTFAPADQYGIAFKRRPQQVLNVVFGKPGRGHHDGGFFPEGVNGVVRYS